MWVYAPEGTPNLWLRIRVLDGEGNVRTLDFTERMNDAMTGSNNTDYGGINWTGWKYVEADLRGYNGPFKLLGGETIRLMHTNGAYGIEAGKGMGDYLPDGTEINRSDCKGSIYIDNLRFVYGANVDDTLAPIIENITANEQELKNGDVFKDNTISFKSYFYDAKNDYTTGIDFSTIYVYIDGKDVTENKNCNIVETDSEIRLDDVVLSNGVHKIKILLRDGFGNETTAERTFIIEGNEDIASVYAEADEEGPTLNKDFKLYLKSDNIENIDKMSVTVNLRKEYLSELNVIFNGNFNGTFDISDTGVICIDAERISSQESSLFNRSNKSNEDVIATIVCKVPYNINKGGKFIYSLTNGLVELNKPYDGEGFPTYSFSGDETSIDVVEELTVEVDTIEVGDTTAKFICL